MSGWTIEWRGPKGSTRVLTEQDIRKTYNIPYGANGVVAPAGERIEVSDLLGQALDGDPEWIVRLPPQEPVSDEVPVEPKPESKPAAKPRGATKKS